MPERDPRVGEIWVVPNTSSRGVVQEIVEGRTTVLSQMGRSASMATTSFLLTWHFSRSPPEEERCSHEGCSSRGHLQMHAGGHWKWVCVEHILPGSDLRFEEGGENPAALEKCPSCGASTNCVGSGCSEVADRFRMHWCGSCHQRWVLLVGSGTPKDKDWIPEVIRTLRKVFEEQELYDFQCFIGNQLASLMSSRVSRLEGIPVVYTNHFGGTQVVLTARGFDQPKEESWKKGTPAVGSIWWDKLNKDPVRVTSCHLIKDRVFISIRPGDLPISPQELLRSVQELSLEDFRRTFDNVAPVIDRGPVQVGDLWMYLGSVSRIIELGNNKTVTLRDGEGNEHSIAEASLRKLWTRVEQKPALARLVEDDPF